MKILLTLLFVATASNCYAQVRGLEAGSAEAAQAVERFRARQREAERSWKESHKITVSKTIPDKPRSSLDCANLKDGDIGYLEYWEFKILQVVSKGNLLAAVGRHDPVWIADVDTSGIVDGQRVRIVGLVKIKGTKTYTTVAGAAKTVRIVNLVPAAEVAKLEAEAAAKKKAAEEARKFAEFNANKRTWVDKTGKFKVDAVFAGEAGSGKIKLARVQQAHRFSSPHASAGELPVAYVWRVYSAGQNRRWWYGNGLPWSTSSYEAFGCDQDALAGAHAKYLSSATVLS